MKKAFLTVVTKQGLEELRITEGIFKKHLKPFGEEGKPKILKIRRYIKPDKWDIASPNNRECHGTILPEITVNPLVTSYYTADPEGYFEPVKYEDYREVSTRVRAALRSAHIELMQAGLGGVVQYSEGYGNSYYNRNMLLEIRHEMVVEGIRAGILRDAGFSRLGEEWSLDELTERIDELTLKTQTEQLSNLPEIKVVHLKDRSEMGLPEEIESLVSEIDAKRGGLVGCSDAVDRLKELRAEFLPSLIELLRDKNEHVRMYMIVILRDLKDKRVGEEIKLLSENDTSNLVRLSAKSALEQHYPEL